MDTLHLTTKPDSETAASKPGKTDRDGQPAGKVDSGEGETDHVCHTESSYLEMTGRPLL